METNMEMGMRWSVRARNCFLLAFPGGKSSRFWLYLGDGNMGRKERKALCFGMIEEGGGMRYSGFSRSVFLLGWIVSFFLLRHCVRCTGRVLDRWCSMGRIWLFFFLSPVVRIVPDVLGDICFPCLSFLLLLWVGSKSESFGLLSLTFPPFPFSLFPIPFSFSFFLYAGTMVFLSPNIWIDRPITQSVDRLICTSCGEWRMKMRQINQIGIPTTT